VLAQLRQIFDADGETGQVLLDSYGDAYSHARRALTKTAAGGNLAIEEALRRKINTVRDDLAGANPTALERILAERVALCWYDACETDRRFYDQIDTSFKTAAVREDRRDHAHRRFLEACKALAHIRKLALPAVQINLARQQLNVAGRT
jgi:hypothetical protein